MLDTDFVRNQWIPALRSGEYIQGFGAYRFINQKNMFCAVGLASYLVNPYELSFANLFTIGLANTDLWREIVQMNDEDRKSFSEIADYLEGVINDLSAS